VIVRVHRNQLNGFRRKARQSNNEIFAMLLGTRLENEVLVTRFAYPALETSKPSCVCPDQDDYERIERLAHEVGLVVVGSIHSHPNWLPVMSPTDHKSHRADRSLVSGVVGWQRNCRSHTYFWRADSSLPCNLKFF
jgi:proteasome lid subunit RPN8/RPN11